MRGLVEYYRKIGLRMYRVRYMLMALVILSIAAVAWIIFSGSGERYLLPAMVFTTWLVLCLSFAYYFAGLKTQLHSDAGWLERLAYSIHRAFSYFLALLFTVVSLLLLYFTSTAIRVATSG